MADWNTPTLTSTYTSVLDTLKNRDIDAALMFDPAFVTPTNVPTNAIRWSSAANRFEKFNGTAWAALSASYLIDVDTLDGQHGSYYLAWANFTGVPATFPPSAHTHDDRYYTETEADGRYGNNLFVSGNTIALRTPGNVALTTITVPYATNAGTVGGFSVGQNLNTNSNVTFAGLTLGATAVTATGAEINHLSGVTSAIQTQLNARATSASPTFTGDVTIADKIIHTGDVDTAIRFPALDTISLETTGLERLRVDDAGRLIVGHNVNIPAPGSVNPRLQVHGASGSDSAVSVARWSANATSPFFWFEKSRGATIGTRGVVQLNDELGSLIFAGDDGTNFSNAATIRAMVDGTPGLADMPGRLEFRTSADGSAAPSERMRIDSLGNVGIGGTANAAAILDLVSTTKGFRAPSMTTTQRDAIGAPVAGLLIYNNTINTYQVYNGTSWTSVGGGATGGGGNAVFWENDQTVTTPYTITSGKNALTAGPITISNGVDVTIPSGSVWTIV